MPFPVTTEASLSEDVPALLRRISRESDPAENVDVAWRVFRDARAEYLDSLRADIPRLPAESRCIIAATIARLEGHDPIEELEARLKSAVEPNRARVAEALGHYLGDRKVSGSENALQNVTRAVKHEDERVRQACLDALVRSRDPEASEVLLSILKSNYPRGSIILKRTRHRRREAIYWILSAVLWCAVYRLGTGSLSFAILGAVGFLFIILLNAVLEVYWVDGPHHLTSHARRDILMALAGLVDVSTPPIRGSLSDLRVLGRGVTGEPKEVRAEARRLVELAEKATQPADALPIAVSAPSSRRAELPLPSEVNG